MTDVPQHWIQALEEVAGRLSQVVVSLDRLGSHAESPEHGSAILTDFIDNWQIFQSMAHARYLVHVLLTETVDQSQLTEDEDIFDRLNIPEFSIWPEPPGLIESRDYPD